MYIHIINIYKYIYIQLLKTGALFQPVAVFSNNQGAEVLKLPSISGEAEYLSSMDRVYVCFMRKKLSRKLRPRQQLVSLIKIACISSFARIFILDGSWGTSPCPP